MEGLKLLQETDQANRVKKYPHVPAHAIPKSQAKDGTSNQLTQAILKWLELNGSWATRVSSAGRYLPTAKKFIPSTTKKGTADIHAVIDGRHASIEVKIRRDKMSLKQEQIKKAIEQSGGLYFIAKNFDSFIEWYNTIKKK